MKKNNDTVLTKLQIASGAAAKEFAKEVSGVHVERTSLDPHFVWVLSYPPNEARFHAGSRWVEIDIPDLLPGKTQTEQRLPAKVGAFIQDVELNDYGYYIEKVRFCIFAEGRFSLVPAAVLVDPAAYAERRFGIADVIRAKHGLKTAQEASEAELLEMQRYGTIVPSQEALVRSIREKGTRFIFSQSGADPETPERTRSAHASTYVTAAWSISECKLQTWEGGKLFKLFADIGPALALALLTTEQTQ